MILPLICKLICVYERYQVLLDVWFCILKIQDLGITCMLENET
jgi:hypothetical protein